MIIRIVRSVKSGTVRFVYWVLISCRVAPVVPERQDACRAHAERSVRARPARESGRPAAIA